MGNQTEEKVENGEAERKRGSTEGTADRGEREEGKRKNGKPSSQNRNRSGRKKAEGKGKARKRKHKGSTGGTAVGAKLGRMKGNKQEAEYEEPGKKTWDTRSERTEKTEGAKVRAEHWKSH